ncbi:MAG: hypothetical protein HYU51_18685 [Candidatus Rokubacteria bacterium]|nr:hypothetical protein [Candidatus Rokubacteria bacterium]
MRVRTIGLSVMALLVVVPGAHAATSEQIEDARTHALAWLLLDQHADGSWKSAAGTEAAATAAAVSVLTRALPGSYAHARGIAWLANATVASVDSRARAVSGLHAAGLDVAASAQQLAAARNAKLTWGAYPGYDTSFPDTALALGAVRVADASFPEPDLQRALCAMLAGQRTDADAAGSWGHVPLAAVPTMTVLPAGVLVPTALNVLEVHALSRRWSTVPCSTRSLATAIDTGTTWLLAKQNPADGGFGDQGASTVMDTVHALAVLNVLRSDERRLASRPTYDAAADAALGYLLGARTTDGSWRGDALQTALALDAFPPLPEPLADRDRDSIPDTVEAVFGTDVLTDDSRFLARGNGRYALTSLAPMRVVAGAPGVTLAVRGDGFTPASEVRWQGAGRPTTHVSATELRAAVGATDLTTAGSFVVNVFTPAPGGGATSPLALTVVNPVPTVAAIAPGTVVAGSPGATLTVTGSGFVATSTVAWNGAPRSTTFVSPAELRATITAADIASAGIAAVAVVTPAPGGGTSAARALTIESPVPELTSLSPSSAMAGGGPFTVTVSGTGFAPSSVVQWNGSSRSTTFVSPTQLLAAVLAADIASAGTATVTVFTPAPGGGTSAGGPFPVNNPFPTLTSLSPTSVTAGSPDITLTVNGTGFVSSSVVRWNGIAQATTFVSPTQLVASIPAGILAQGGYANVSVVSPPPGGGSTGVLTLTVENPPPALASLSPSTVMAGGSSFTVTLRGSGFTASSIVYIVSSPRSKTFISATELQSVMAAFDIATGGARSVWIVNPPPGGGTSQKLTLAVDNPVPSVTTVSPASAVAGAAPLTLTIAGTGFVSASSVRWNGLARSTAYASSTQLRASIPASDLATVGTASITVNNGPPAGGTSAPVPFTVTENTGNPVPSIAYLSQKSIAAGSPPFTLAVTGSGFVAGSVLHWNGAPRATTVLSATQLLAAITETDVAAVGTAEVSLFNPSPGGGSSAPAPFAITEYAENPIPALTSLSPKYAYVGDGAFTLVATGTSLTRTTVLRWNGHDRPTTYVSGRQVRAAIPVSDVMAPGTAAISLFTPAPGGGTSETRNLLILANPAPSVTSMSPSSAAPGGPGFTLTVAGSGFVRSSVVRWNGQDRPTTFVSSARLQAAVPASDIASFGTASVSVFSPAPGGGSSTARIFSVENPPPALLSITPASAPLESAGLTLSLTGFRFLPSSVVRWNGMDRPTTYVSSTQLQAAIPASDLRVPANASVGVSVFNPPPGGGTSGSVLFVVGGSPVTTSLAPSAAGAGAEAFTLSIHGLNFTATSSVSWHGRATTPTYVSSTELRIGVPAIDLTTSGTRSVQVSQTGLYGGDSNVATFTVKPVPDIVLDDGQPGTSFTGEWLEVFAADALGQRALASSGTGEATYRWTPTIPLAGGYEVSLWWPSGPGSASMPVTIADATGRHEVDVDQTLAAGQWRSIGTFTFGAGSSGYVEVSTTGPDRIVADAARFAPVTTGEVATLSVSKSLNLGDGTVTAQPGGIDCGTDCTETYLGGSTVTLAAVPAPGSTFTGWTGDADCADGVVTLTASRSCVAVFAGDEIVIDNGQPGTSFTGSWSIAAAPAPYGADALVATGMGGATYRWTPAIPAGWQYQVFIWWPPDATLSATVPVTISAYEPLAASPWIYSRTANQQAAGGQWQLLGTFGFLAGSSGYVEISDAGGRAAADAVRFVPYGPLPPADSCGGCGGGEAGGF